MNVKGTRATWQHLTGRALPGRVAADGFAFLAPVQCFPLMPVAMVKGKVTYVSHGADNS